MCPYVTDASGLPLVYLTKTKLCPYPHTAPDARDCSSLVTLNTLPLEVTVHYPFHPYVNRTFKVLQRSGSAHSQITLEHSLGKPFTIPIWMTEPTARDFCVDVSINIDLTVYLDILALLETSCFAVAPLAAAKTIDEPRKF